jgi:hypothetical protein
MKNVLKAAAGALGITVVSCILLTLTRGMPNREHLLQNALEMFVVAFAVLLLYGKKMS